MHHSSKMNRWCIFRLFIFIKKKKKLKFMIVLKITGLCPLWNLFMQPSMGTLNSPSLRIVKDSTPSLEVLKFRDWWILTYFIFGHGESSLNNFWSMVNLERTCVLLFYYFLCLKGILTEKKNKSAWWIFTQLYFRDGESWPNYFGKEVNW